MSEAAWLDDEEYAAWRGFMAMHSVITAELARRLAADSQLSYQDYEVLVILTEQPKGALRLLELADLIGWEKSRLSHHVTRMAKRGLVEKRPSMTDRRGQVVSVTPLGRREIRAAAPGHVEAVRELFIDRLSRAQLATIAQVSKIVLSNASPSA